MSKTSIPASRLLELSSALPRDVSMTILPSSVCPGLGVYAIKKIKKNQILGSYPGSVITDREDAVLRDYFVQWARNPSLEITEIEERLGILLDRFGIKLCNFEAPTHRRQVSTRELTYRDLNWPRLLIALNSYSFQTDKGTLVPNRMSYTGNPIYDLELHMTGGSPLLSGSLTPMLNEAPPWRFENLLTRRIQYPKYNVNVLVEGDSVVFYAQQPVDPGDEMFFFYGPIYDREYPINLKPADCGWDWSDWEGMSTKEKRTTKSFFLQQDRFIFSNHVVKPATKNRLVDMEMTLELLIRSGN